MLSTLTRLSCLFFFFASFTLNAEAIDCRQHQCVSVVDAGSTGSRLHIYTYDLDKTNTPINIKELWSKKVKPGFATLETNQATLDAYLTILFADAPADHLPVYFYATAGMRLLPQAKQAQRYALLKNWFAGQSQWQLRSARTITGREEGVFGWLAVNYQLGAFSNNDKNSLGVMDMGGASVQVTFPMENTEAINHADIQELDLYGRHLKLFTHSFLGLGQNELSHQFLDVTSCFSQNYELSTGVPATGDAYRCEGEIAVLINAVHHVNDVVQPALKINPIERWFVLGGVAELTKSPPFHFEANQFTNQALLDQAETQICQQQWTDLSAQYPANDFLYAYCLFPSYYYALIVEGYGLSSQQKIGYMPDNQGGDWTLGVVLYNQK
ncbi:multidrug DMT transporter permease [Legionella fairfieldensis]|uniref:multidrug DMT transporter permease n=1 Tax=Legionella fairfieldensis TaxID=45064 RepID=UPI00048C38CD|nr:multidrug DMT transporter permease [Legionella fairfieldensis]